MKALFALALFVAVTIPLGLCADRDLPDSVILALAKVVAKARAKVDDKVLEIVLRDQDLKEIVLHKAIEIAIADPELKAEVLNDTERVLAGALEHEKWRERVLEHEKWREIVLGIALAEVNADPELRGIVLAEANSVANSAANSLVEVKKKEEGIVKVKRIVKVEMKANRIEIGIGIVDDEEEEKQKSSGLTGGSRYFAGMTGVTVISVILVILVIAGLNWQSQHRKSGYFADAGRLQK